MDVKLIASDIDGTLIRSDGFLSETTRYALEKAAQQGAVVVLATGRTRMTMVDLLEKLPMVQYIICSNGASIWDCKNQTVLANYCIPCDLFAPILDILCNDNICWHCFCDGKGYMDESLVGKLNHIFKTRTPLKTNFGSKVFHIKNARDYIVSNMSCVEKFGVVTDDVEARQRVLNKLKQIPELSISSATWFNLEINMKEATKGNALNFLINHLNLQKEEVLAFGDNLNDCTLLNAAGVGVAMGNASEELLPYADCQTQSNDEDGLAKFVARAMGFSIPEIG